MRFSNVLNVTSLIILILSLIWSDSILAVVATFAALGGVIMKKLEKLEDEIERNKNLLLTIHSKINNP